jgi:hypothetical protein
MEFSAVLMELALIAVVSLDGSACCLSWSTWNDHSVLLPRLYPVFLSALGLDFWFF